MATSVRKLIVEVVDARNLSPKDGQGTSSPYVVVDYYGQRKRTQTKLRELNPVWNELLEFNVGKPSDVFGDVLELDVYHDKNYGPTRRSNFLGRIRLSSTQFVKKGEEALIYFPLDKKSLLSWIQGEIGLKIYYLDEVEVEVESPPPKTETPPPPPPQAEEPKNETLPTPPPADAAPPQQPDANPPPEQQPPTTEAAPPPAAGAKPPPTPSNKPAEEPQTETAAPPPDEAAASEVGGADHPAPKTDADANDQDQEAGPPPPPLPPEIETMAAFVSKPVPDKKFHGRSDPPPMPGWPQAPPQLNNYTSQLEPTESMSMDRPSFDLVEKMHYLFVRVVKARFLPANGSPVVKISTANYHITSKPARKTHCFEWDQTFAFARHSLDEHSSDASLLEVSVWDPPVFEPDLASGHRFLGGICFDVAEIPLRDPPDSPLAPQWYRLEEAGARINGDVMLATWMGTQADESFPEAWKTDTAGNPNARAKIYQSPKLWYLRATVMEAQEVLLPSSTLSKESTFQVKAQLGFQSLKTEPAVARNGAPSWNNQDLMFVAAEPFLTDGLIFTVESRLPKGPVTLGVARVPLTAIERRVDDRKVASRWLTLENPDPEEDEKGGYRGRIHLRLCFDGGYHVMDEAAHLCSDYRPTARQLWKPPLGTVELGVIGCRSLIPVKTVNGKGCTDAYCVAKYGPKWVRTRTVCDSLEPKWNEQYTFKVYDPCTVLTVGVFDDSSGSSGLDLIDGGKDATRPDLRIGKLRVRISTLATGTVYRNTYPLLVLTPAGLKKMGEVEVAVRFVRMSPPLDLIHVYSQPSLPLMHHIKALGAVQQEVLRRAAVKIVAAHLSRSEPSMGREVVIYLLDADSPSQGFSMRKVRANYFRVVNVVAGAMDVVAWINDTRSWKKPMATILVHALLVLLVWFPDLIVPTLAFYVFVIGAWNYRFRGRRAPHFDPKLSLAESVDREELDEEFDGVPSSRSFEVVRARYDKLRMLGARVQTLLGDLAAHGERVQALVTWRDPRATGIFVGLCLVVAMILYAVPSKMVAMAFGFYYLRHPIFRDRMPSPALNFIRRLPSLSDRLL